MGRSSFLLYTVIFMVVFNGIISIATAGPFVDPSPVGAECDVNSSPSECQDSSLFDPATYKLDTFTSSWTVTLINSLLSITILVLVIDFLPLT